MNRFISIFFITIFIVFIFSLCFFIPMFSQYGLVQSYNLNTNDAGFSISSSSLLWPTPRF